MQSRFLPVILLLPALVFVSSRTEAQEARAERAGPGLSIPAFKAHLKFLADDLCEGRAPGTRGGDLAARYIATQFEAAGLEPISEKTGYFQSVPMLGNLVDHRSVRLELRAGKQVVTATVLDDAIVASEVAEPEVRLEDDLLFVGYGIDAPEHDWDDYKGKDVRGKVLVMLVNDPDLEKTGFGSESLTYYGRWTYKQEIARVKGARGLLLLHTDKSATYGFDVVRSSWAVERVSLEGEIHNPLAVSGWISRPAIDRALKPLGLDYAALKAKADNRGFRPFPLGLRMKVAFRQRFRKFSSPNVIGLLRGAAKADEAVIYMGHYDHLGVGPEVEGDCIYNGAIDNASGTAALICLARAFVEAPERPARTVIFLATTGEEKGLLGSEYYTVHPVVPLEKTALVLNKDCCNFYGRRAGFGVFGVRYTDAVEVFEKLGRDLDLELGVGKVDRGGGAFRVDSFPFNARGVVGLSFWLRGRYLSLPDKEAEALRKKAGRWYHQPSDEIRPDWRYDGILQEMTALYHLGRHFTDGGRRPRLGAGHPYGPAIRLRERKYTSARPK